MNQVYSAELLLERPWLILVSQRMPISKDAFLPFFTTPQPRNLFLGSTYGTVNTIVPKGFLTIMTGGIDSLAFITSPLDGVHMIAILCTNISPGTLQDLGGNIKVTSRT